MDAIEWARLHVEPTGEAELVHDRPWSNVWRVPAGNDVMWLKQAKPVQFYEPRLTATLYARWPDRVTEVIAHDAERGLLLLGDAGTPVGAFGNSPDAWAAALPLYAELQRAEAAHVDGHLAHGVPDLRTERLLEEYAQFYRDDIPLDDDDRERLRRFEPTFAELCAELEPLATLDHGDLHVGNVYAKGDRMLLTDWGDTTVAHPFFSLVVTFRFLAEVNKLPPDDPAYARLRAAYLEPWGDVDRGQVDRALRVGQFQRCFTWFRIRDAMPADYLVRFDEWFPKTLAFAIAQI